MSIYQRQQQYRVIDPVKLRATRLDTEGLNRAELEISAG